FRQAPPDHFDPPAVERCPPAARNLLLHPVAARVIASVLPADAAVRHLAYLRLCPAPPAGRARCFPVADGVDPGCDRAPRCFAAHAPPADDAALPVGAAEFPVVAAECPADAALPPGQGRPYGQGQASRGRRGWRSSPDR